MTRDRKGNYARMKESVRQEDIAILILCAPNNRAVKCEAKTNRTERRNRQIYNYSWRLQYLFFLIVWLHCVACGILVPQPGTEYRSLVVKVQVLITGPPGNVLQYPINHGQNNQGENQQENRLEQHYKPTRTNRYQHNKKFIQFIQLFTQFIQVYMEYFPGQTILCQDIKQVSINVQD